MELTGHGPVSRLTFALSAAAIGFQVDLRG